MLRVIAASNLIHYIKFVCNATKFIENSISKRINFESVAAEESSGDEIGAKRTLSYPMCESERTETN